ncbi:MAG TPA: EscR/YscR/HrcR family type III secretion system export apparatus protein [Thiothrix sp.]|nr:EscR/YscR/HrcR family type III secretion system export apparatus protein [Thiothrix sp.]
MDSLPNPILLIGLMGIMSLAPFIAVLISSFLKIVVVMHMVRSALGLQQSPPNLAMNGIAIILSMFIMAPVASGVYDRFESHNVVLTDIQNPELKAALSDSIMPVKDFLKRHSSDKERVFFSNATKKLWPEEYAKTATEDHLLVLTSAFLVSELTSAFEIGFLLYLPFVVIDLIVANILISMGMIMVAPIMISLPFKVLLFVLIDGWSKLTHGLVMSYQ